MNSLKANVLLIIALIAIACGDGGTSTNCPPSTGHPPHSTVLIYDPETQRTYVETADANGTVPLPCGHVVS